MFYQKLCETKFVDLFETNNFVFFFDENFESHFSHKTNTFSSTMRMQKFENLSTITVNCKMFCEIFTQTKLTDVLYRFLYYFPNFLKDILQNKKVILHKLLQEFCHVISLIHGLNHRYLLLFPTFILLQLNPELSYHHYTHLRK